MNEITVVTMSWWQVALFTMVIFFYGYLLNMLTPLIEKKLREVEWELKQKTKLREVLQLIKEDTLKPNKEGYLLSPEVAEEFFKYIAALEPLMGAPRQKPKPKPRNKEVKDDSYLK